MPLYLDADFPQAIAFGAVGGPEYSTVLADAPSGGTRATASRTVPRYRYQLSTAPQDAEGTLALLAFFHAVAKGRAYAFRFRDFAEGESTGVNEPLGTGTGIMSPYQLIKRYRLGSLTYDRPIQAPVAATLAIRANGVLLAPSAWELMPGTGEVMVQATLGATLTASFTFDVPVRFVQEQCSIQRLDGAYLWQGIELLEVLPLPPHAGSAAFVEHWEYMPSAARTGAGVTEHWAP